MIFALAIIVLTVGVGLYLAYPLLTQGRGRRTLYGARVEDLRVRRDQLFHDIRELEFDHRMGKLSDSDYEQLLDQLKEEAATVVDALERIEQESPEKAPSRPAEPADGDIEAMIARARQRIPATGKATAKCPSCGAENPVDARFCNTCGAALAVETKGKA